jgi:NADPH:quinone reductase-like Zn-dependent oxidoreductase
VQAAAEAGRDLSLDGGVPRSFLILVLITPLFGGKKVMFALPKLDQATVGHFKELIESGQFKRLINRRYRLDQIIEASKYVETGQKIGNVVISVERQN